MKRRHRISSILLIPETIRDGSTGKNFDGGISFILQIPKMVLMLALLLYVAASSCLPVLAEQGSGPYTSNDGTVFYMPKADTTKIIYDYADLFTDSQEAALTEKLSKLSDEKKAEIMILTSYDIPKDVNYGTETTQKYAEEFMYENAISDDRTILMMDMNNRIVAIYGQGRFYGDDKFVDMANNFYNDIYDEMVAGDYVSVADQYITYIHRFRNILYAMIPTPLSLGISAILSAITLVGLSARHKSTQPSKATQIPIKTLGYRRTGHDSRYLGKTVTHRVIPKPEPNRGGGGGGFSGGHSSGGGFSGHAGGSSGGGGHF
ncbi:MAG: TPM domain-containing protein [Lachnospiraceae bacterium]|nr:TPM domain-containing protein [Lachnospiraceae bacterium]